jgi:anti-sigma regulatory factor (Ser/Thr protein kinase)
VRDLFRGVVPLEMTETAELLTSELVTNAVRHGAGVVTLTIERSPDAVSIHVADEEPGEPQVQPERLMSVGGRGLRMVQSLAGAWGVTPRDDGPGKVVWFRLP